MKASVFIATSLDGFIARVDGSIDWLPHGEPDDPTQDYGFGHFMKSVDALVMGRGTFDKVLAFSTWPYGKKPVIVLTHRPLTMPKHKDARVEVMSGDLPEIVRSIEARGLHHIYVDGGRTIQSFLRSNLIDAVTITRIPVLIGKGIPLFGPLETDIPFEHKRTRSFKSGFVQSEYAVKR